MIKCLLSGNSIANQCYVIEIFILKFLRNKRMKFILTVNYVTKAKLHENDNCCCTS